MRNTKGLIIGAWLFAATGAFAAAEAPVPAAPAGEKGSGVLFKEAKTQAASAAKKAGAAAATAYAAAKKAHAERKARSVGTKPSTTSKGE